MIKLIILDYDGVCVDMKNLHYLALNQVLAEISPSFIISIEDHLNKFDGLPTKTKLKILNKERNFPLSKIDEVDEKKQILTLKLMSEIKKDNEKIHALKELKKLRYQIFVASNATDKTIILGLEKLGISDYIDMVFHNKSIKKPKPNSEIYLKCFIEAGVNPKEALIIEDSPKGIEAAIESGAHVMTVRNSSEVTLQSILYNIDKIENKDKKLSYINRKLNVLIPMAGAGSRFAKKGYSLPKPLIEIPNMDGKPMIQVVVENLNIDANYIFLAQKEHITKYNLNYLLNLIKPNSKIIEVDGLTQGAACTVLLAKELINNNNPLLIANSDQFIEDWNPFSFFYKMNQPNIDGGILNFKATGAKWSFVDIINDKIFYVAEKQQISDNANVGIYYFSEGKDCVWAIEEMIRKNLKYKEEYYLAPCFNELIRNNKTILPYFVNKMYGIGTPEDLEYFVNNFKNEKNNNSNN